MKPIQVALMGFIALCAAITPWAVAADSSKSRLEWQHEDWELVCDNTRTCRAAGYQADGPNSSEPVSMLIERQAGPNTPVQIWLQLGDEKASGLDVSLRVGKLLLRTVPTLTEPQRVGEWGKTLPDSLDKNQVRQLLPALLNNTTAVVQNGDDVWTLSLQGLSAVLLKMDDFQGRLNTPGALVKPGNRPETDVRPALAIPVVHTVLPLPDQPGDKALAQQIFSTINLLEVQVTCPPVFTFNEDLLEVYRLIGHKLLLSLDMKCGSIYSKKFNWIANDQPPHKPRKIEAEGAFNAKDGSISGGLRFLRSFRKCDHVRTWHFTGDGFVLTRIEQDHLCRGFDGGAWNLLHYRAKPVPTSKPKFKSSQKSKNR